MQQNCSYQGCNQKVLFPNEENLCVFHHYTNNDVDNNTFNKLFVTNKIDKQDYNFEGFIFNYFYDFKSRLGNFHSSKIINFKKCKFIGKSNILNNSECVSFKEMTIQNADFSETEFSKGVNCFKTDFRTVKFEKCKFLNGESNFIGSNLENANFSKCEFNGNINFNKAKFYKNVSFEKSKFQNGEINFTEAEFSVKCSDFTNIIIYNCEVNFTKINSVRSSLVNYEEENKHGWLFNYSLFEKCKITFENAQIVNHSLCFDYSNFKEESHLHFNSMNFKGSGISFNGIKGILYTLNFDNSNITCQYFVISVSEILISTISFNYVNFISIDNNKSSLIRICDLDNTGDFSMQRTNIKDIDISFESIKFHGSYTKFDQSEFECKVFFINVSFWHENSFINTNFFKKTTYNNVFFADKVKFDKTYFESEITFENCKCRTNSILYFQNIIFVENSLLTFRNFEQENITIGSDIPIYSNLLIFEYINFLAHRTIFENIFTKQDYSLGENILLFRYCLLKDVYFINNQMTLFSFYKSLFDEAIFINCEWNTIKDKILFFKYNRPNVIFEDNKLIDFSKLDSKTKGIQRALFKLINLDFKELESMYRRLKTALDKSKNYWQAGWFYFNEYEMKRLDCKEHKNIKGNKIINRSRRLTLYLYKLFAGYGEKPHWSIIWFVFFCMLFSILHLFNGININNGYINYDLDFTKYYNLIEINFILKLIQDWFSSILYTFARILPVGYFKIGSSDIFELGTIDFILQLSNTVILILFATFIGIGLKRYFRRF